jgi:hypothetical protein
MGRFADSSSEAVVNNSLSVPPYINERSRAPKSRGSGDRSSLETVVRDRSLLERAHLPFPRERQKAGGPNIAG